MVGMHPNSPQNPHSAPASGGDNIGDIRNDPPVPAHVLYGAVVGGPLENDQFWDWRDDWVQTEVSSRLGNAADMQIALDYNAHLPEIAAVQVSPPARITN
jgi:endoglucanase